MAIAALPPLQNPQRFHIAMRPRLTSAPGDGGGRRTEARAAVRPAAGLGEEHVDIAPTEGRLEGFQGGFGPQARDDWLILGQASNEIVHGAPPGGLRVAAARQRDGPLASP